MRTAPTGTPPAAGTAPPEVKEAIRRTVTAHRDALLELSTRIHRYPETAFREHRAAAWCAELLRSGGFEVTAPVPSPGTTATPTPTPTATATATATATGASPSRALDTAFLATIGTGPLTVALVCEYDALPGLGHACGHNLIAAAGVGAALGLAPYTAALGLTVRVVGAPAEERGAGKALLLDAGAFDGVDAAMMVHPCPFEVADFRSFALGTLSVTYTGRAAHPSIDPHRGRNAADALTVAQVALGLLRQQLPPHWKVHGVTTFAGRAPNAIPDRATAAYEIRATAAEDLAELRRRVTDCFRAGALATGCEVEIERPEPDYLDFRGDPLLTGLWTANARALGRAEPTSRAPFACTDMGNVSHVVPAIHPVLDISGGACGPHEAEFAAAADPSRTPAAERALLDGALGMAWTAADYASVRRA